MLTFLSHPERYFWRSRFRRCTPLSVQLPFNQRRGALENAHVETAPKKSWTVGSENDPNMRKAKKSWPDTDESALPCPGLGKVIKTYFKHLQPECQCVETAIFQVTGPVTLRVQTEIVGCRKSATPSVIACEIPRDIPAVESQVCVWGKLQQIANCPHMPNRWLLFMHFFPMLLLTCQMCHLDVACRFLVCFLPLASENLENCWQLFHPLHWSSKTVKLRFLWSPKTI